MYTAGSFVCSRSTNCLLINSTVLLRLETSVSTVALALPQQLPTAMDKYYDDFVKGMASQSGKVFAITGTTSGTGFEAARALVGKGGTVFCLNRPSDRASASLASLQEACADGGAAKQIDCDLQDFASVRAAAATVAAETTATGINALLNNAGVSSGARGRAVSVALRRLRFRILARRGTLQGTCAPHSTARSHS